PATSAARIAASRRSTCSFDIAASSTRQVCEQECRLSVQGVSIDSGRSAWAGEAYFGPATEWTGFCPSRYPLCLVGDKCEVHALRVPQCEVESVCSERAPSHLLHGGPGR